MSNCDWSEANYLSPTVRLDFSWTLPLTKWSVRKAIRESEPFFECHVYYLRAPTQKGFWMSLKFKIRHCKNFQCSLNKSSLQCQTVTDQGLYFTYCSGRLLLDPWNVGLTHWSVRKAIWKSKEFPDYPVTNCSVGLQFYHRNVRLRKWSVRKAIWQSE